MVRQPLLRPLFQETQIGGFGQSAAHGSFSQIRATQQQGERLPGRGQLALEARKFSPGLFERDLRAQLLLVGSRPGSHSLARCGGGGLRHLHQLSGHIHQALGGEHLVESGFHVANQFHAAQGQVRLREPDAGHANLAVELLLAGKRNGLRHADGLLGVREVAPTAHGPILRAQGQFRVRPELGLIGATGGRIYASAGRAQFRVVLQREADRSVQRQDIGCGTHRWRWRGRISRLGSESQEAAAAEGQRAGQGTQNC